MSAPITTTLNLTTAAAPTAAQKAVADPTAALTQAMQKAEVKCEAKDEECKYKDQRQGKCTGYILGGEILVC